jgi:hypothetical protein
VVALGLSGLIQRVVFLLARTVAQVEALQLAAQVLVMQAAAAAAQLAAILEVLLLTVAETVAMGMMTRLQAQQTQVAVVAAAEIHRH